MIGLGTIINSAAIVAGGVIGHFTGRLFRQEQQDALTMACGISVLFIAIAGAMQGMLHIDNGNLLSGKSMLVVLCLAFGTIIGEMIGIENGFERFGEWLKMKTGNSGDKQFVNAFVTASLTVCIGAMAIVGAIQDGISGDYSTLATHYDRNCCCISLTDRIRPDLLRGSESGLGKDGPRGQYASGGCICRACGVSSVVILREREIMKAILRVR